MGWRADRRIVVALLLLFCVLLAFSARGRSVTVLPSACSYGQRAALAAVVPLHSTSTTASLGSGRSLMTRRDGTCQWRTPPRHGPPQHR